MTDLVFDGGFLRAALCPAQGRQILITFDFRKDGRVGFGPMPKSGRLALRGWDHLHLSTARNDWFLNPDTDQMEQAVSRQLSRYFRVHLLGYSMGAYGALRFAAPFGAAKAIAVSPFVSLLPEVAPGEHRHSEDLPFWREAGKLAAIPAAPGLTGHVVVDPDIAPDLAQARAVLTRFPTLGLICLPGGGHPATKRQRETGQGADVLDLALADENGVDAGEAGRPSDSAPRTRPPGLGPSDSGVMCESR